MKLCGNDLPWVNFVKHLGTTIEDKVNWRKSDIKAKRTYYINKNNELCQEVHFCHPLTKFHFNSIYNSNFTGSPLWNLFI